MRFHQCSLLLKVLSLDSLPNLPLNERVLLVESLWEDLSPAAAGLPVPQWQREVLDEREKRVAEGTVRYIDWEIAKREILEAVK